MTSALSHVLPVFIVIGLGYLLRALGFLREAAIEALSRLVFYVAAPLLLMHGLAQTPSPAARTCPPSAW